MKSKYWWTVPVMMLALFIAEPVNYTPGPIVVNSGYCTTQTEVNDIILGEYDYFNYIERDIQELRIAAKKMYGVNLTGWEEYNTSPWDVDDSPVLILTSRNIENVGMDGNKSYPLGMACGSVWAIAKETRGCKWDTALHEIGHLIGYNHSAPPPVSNTTKWNCDVKEFDPCDEGGPYHRRWSWSMATGRVVKPKEIIQEWCPELLHPLQDKWGEEDVYGRPW